MFSNKVLETTSPKYCVSRTKLLTSGDIELNPEPVVLREIIQTIVLNCYNLDKHNMA